MLPQPDETTCGPTCLHSVYRYWGHDIPLDRIIHEVKRLKHGGTLAVLLGLHALGQGFSAQIYTYNLNIFDPTWFRDGVDVQRKLAARIGANKNSKLRKTSKAYIEFLERGGKILFRDLTTDLLRGYLQDGIPVLTGLSATYLYQHERESDDGYVDDISGKPAGHFVVLSGYNRKRNSVSVSDPYEPNPLGEGTQHYDVSAHRVVTAILLGVLTYDGNLLIITPTGSDDG